MILAETLLRQLDNPALSHDERAQLQCQIAADFEHRGQYDVARGVLADLWQGIGQRPTLEGLTECTAAEVLLRIGALSAWFASAAQDKEGQAAAKDLISESITRFQALAEPVRAAAAQSELGYCYWREGAYDEARIVYADALSKLADHDDPELRAKILIRRVLVESCSGRYNDSLRILTEATQPFGESTNHALKGKFHNEFGLVLRKLGTDEHRPDYTDRAILEYTAASFHFEQAGHISYRASAESNLGFLLYTIRRYEEAHQHLNRARRLFLSVNNSGRIAQVDEALARVLLAEGRIQEAARFIREAVQTLSKGGEQGVLSEALITQGRVLSRLGNFTESQNTLRHAADIAEQAGAVEDAGRALLALIEEHIDRLTERELLETYQRADDLLKETQDAETIKRLRACARRTASARLAAMPTGRGRHRSTADFWTNFSLFERAHAYEARYIQRALIESHGSITSAARLLGLKHHASLAALLERRHKNLAHLRTPPEKRRQSIIPENVASRRAARTRRVKILHVEDNKMIADAVKDMFEGTGWKVETCDSGTEAMRKIKSKARYDLLIFDNEVPGHNGIELVRSTREFSHRHRVPIIMLSASDVESEAWRAGVNAFLRKPEDIGQLSAMVTRLLNRQPDKHQ